MRITQMATPNSKLLPRTKNVAIYCRVSTRQHSQSQSLEAQEEYLSAFAAAHLLWSVVGVYCDKASGLNNLKMPAFQHMMNDCRNGKIDLVIVKSISRVGRNTVQVLNICRELKSLGVDMYFDIEKTFLCDTRSELMITIYASLYQDESESKSYSIRWGNRVHFENGTSCFYNRICYGYKHNTEGQLVIDSEKAEIVKRIFRWRTENASLRKIADRLRHEEIPAPRYGKKWNIETIRKY